MRSISFLIFFSIVLLIYGSVNSYIFIRGLQAFSLTPIWKKSFSILFWVIVSCFIVGEVLEHTHSTLFGEWIYRIGAFWMAFMLYFTLTLIAFDLIRLANWGFHFLPEFSPVGKFQLGLATIGFVSIIVILGHLNALNTRVREITVDLSKKAEGSQTMTLLMASDIHLGALIGENREEHLVSLIKDKNPDLVLLCGDLVDGDIASVLRKNLGRHIQEIKTPFGVYAIPGNHEYIGGISKTIPYLESVNIKILRDQVVNLPNGVQLVGRDDRSNHGFGENAGRKSLKQLMDTLNKNLPIIVMNHQPFNLEEAADLHVDIHLSGHTHHGQLWPFGYLTDKIYEVSWGFKKIKDTYFYVSSGFGTWGPPVRTGNTPEVLFMHIRFNKQNQ